MNSFRTGDEICGRLYFTFLDCTEVQVKPNTMYSLLLRHGRNAFKLRTNYRQREETRSWGQLLGSSKAPTPHRFSSNKPLSRTRTHAQLLIYGTVPNTTSKKIKHYASLGISLHSFTEMHTLHFNTSPADQCPYSRFASRCST